MRGAIIGVAVLILAGGIAFLVFGPTGGSEPAVQPAADSAAPAEPTERAPVPTLSDAERAALAALEDELSDADRVERKSDAERLAEARAWVEANRPADRAFNEFEAQMLALMDVLIDGEERSAEWAMNMSQMEIEMIRAIDADGDGQVSDDEVQLFIDENIAALFNPMEHPYLQERFDTDGDGQTSEAEMMAFAAKMSEGALAGAFERGKLEAWDTDNDGRLSAEERVAGEQAADDRVRQMLSQMAGPMGAEQLDAWLGSESQTPEERASAREAFYETVGPEAAAGMEAQRQMMLSQLAAESFLNDMRVDNLPQPQMEEIMGQMPQPPDVMSFDIDGDGQFADDEAAARDQAMTEYQRAVERWGSEFTAYRLKEQFDNSLAQSDADGDGRMSPDEWDRRIDDLLYERDQRLFERSYDLDGSGRVEASELVEFLEWYRAGSLRADFNYDGTLDAFDLEGMAGRFQSQGG